MSEQKHFYFFFNNNPRVIFPIHYIDVKDMDDLFPHSEEDKSPEDRLKGFPVYYDSLGRFYPEPNDPEITIVGEI